MRPPGLACLKNARNFDGDRNKMSKKEKRFDPARAPLPTRMPEYFNVNLIQSQLPHQPESYLISGEELIAACAHNMEDQVYYLIKVRMSDVNFRSLPTGQTPIMFATNPRIAEILLKEGADPNAQNRMGNTALHFAVADNNLEMAAMLLRYGAHRRLKNASAQGITACQVQVNSNISREVQAARISPMEKIMWPRQYQRQAPLENMLCIDFEMIGIANPQWGHHVMLDFPIEVGIVDSNLNTVYHRRCRPDFLPQTGKLSGKHFKKLYSPPIDRTLDRPSIDLRTWITGIRPGDLDFQPLASQVLAEVRQIIQGKYLVGHSIEHDLCVLQHFGPPEQGVRDTSQFLRWKGKKISLKKAAKTFLNLEIQKDKHSALEDAKTTMELYLLLKDEWESSDEPFLLPANQIRQIVKVDTQGDETAQTADNKIPKSEIANQISQNTATSSGSSSSIKEEKQFQAHHNPQINNNSQQTDRLAHELINLSLNSSSVLK